MPADFVFTEEHEALRQNLRAFLEKRSDEKAVRAAMVSERGFEPEVWKQLARELGLAGLVIPEEHGGAGYGPVELLIAMEEMGRALLCAPYFARVLAAGAIINAGTEAESRGCCRGSPPARQPRRWPGSRITAAGTPRAQR